MASHLPPSLSLTTAQLTSRSSAGTSDSSTSLPSSTTSTTGLSLSPLTFNAEITHAQRDRQQQSTTRLAGGLVAAASPSPASSSFPYSSRSPNAYSFPPDAESPRFQPAPRPWNAQERVNVTSSNPPSLPRYASTSFRTDHSPAEQPRTQSPPSSIYESLVNEWIPSGVGSSSSQPRSTGEKRYREEEEEGSEDEVDELDDQDEQRQNSVDRQEEEPESGKAGRRRRRSQKTTSTVSFIYKLFDMLADPNNAQLITYGTEGDSFEVRDPDAFARIVLPQYFKHSNFASFIRQLNMWGWRKESRQGEWNFVHPIFRRGRPENLPLIKRSDETRKKTAGLISHRSNPRTSPKGKVNRTGPFTREPRRFGSRHRRLTESEAAREDALSVDTSTKAVTSGTQSSNSAPAAVETSAVNRVRATLPHEYLPPHARDPPPTPRPPQYDGSFLPSGYNNPSFRDFAPLRVPTNLHRPQPIQPPTFLEQPRHVLPPPPSFQTSTANGIISEQAALLEEATKRASMTVALLEHLVYRLDINLEAEQYRSFPFYVFDPRFTDPSVPLRYIIDDYDARRNSSSSNAPSQTHSSERSYHHDPHAIPRHSSIASSAFDPYDDRMRRASVASSTPVPIDLTVPPAHPMATSSSSAATSRHGSFDSSAPQHEHFPPPTPTIGLGITYEETTTTMNQGDHHLYEPPPPPELLRQRRSHSIAVPTSTNPQLGPSSFSLVDFDDSSRSRPSTSAAEYSQRVTTHEQPPQQHPLAETTVVTESSFDWPAEFGQRGGGGDSDVEILDEPRRTTESATDSVNEENITVEDHEGGQDVVDLANLNRLTPT